MPDQIVSCVCCKLLVLFNACFNRASHNAVAFLTKEEYKIIFVITPQITNYLREIQTKRITEVYVVIVFAKKYLSLDGYYLSCSYIQN